MSDRFVTKTASEDLDETFGTLNVERHLGTRLRIESLRTVLNDPGLLRTVLNDPGLLRTVRNEISLLRIILNDDLTQNY